MPDNPEQRFGERRDVMKKCDVCKGFPAPHWLGDDYGEIAMCDQCVKLHGYDSYKNEIYIYQNGERVVVAHDYSTGVEWVPPHHPPKPYNDPNYVAKRAPTPPEKANRAIGIPPGGMVVIHERKCGNPGKGICMFRNVISFAPDLTPGDGSRRVLLCPLAPNDLPEECRPCH
jgi:hypothetical protein